MKPRLFPERAPPGPFRPETFSSPIRGRWVTSVLGLWLLVAIVVLFVTGLVSNIAYESGLGHNRIVAGPRSLFELLSFRWPTRPSWIFAADQGLHVTLGIATIPVLLAKLWSVIPKLWDWPPVRSPAHAAERATLALLVGAGLFEFATGTLNVQVYYPWHFDFLSAHYYGAWVFMAAFVLHAGLKLPTARRAVHERRVIDELRVNLRDTRPEPAAAGGPVAPAAPTMSRRGLLGLVVGASAGLTALTAGQSIGGPLRRIALLAPHGRSLGSGPNDFQINKTAYSVGVTRAQTGAGWRLAVHGEHTIDLSRADLLAAPQHSHDLPIACVEGWSTTQRWTGVRLGDLGAMAGVPGAHQLTAQSLEHGKFGQATFSETQIADPRSLLALQVNGAPLSLDHGFPARIIVPGAPGVHCTKWVSSLTFAKA